MLKKTRGLCLKEPLFAEAGATRPGEVCHHREKNTSGGAEQLELCKRQVCNECAEGWHGMECSK